jgi:hypothetical protein
MSTYRCTFQHRGKTITHDIQAATENQAFGKLMPVLNGNYAGWFNLDIKLIA